MLCAILCGLVILCMTACAGSSSGSESEAGSGSESKGSSGATGKTSSYTDTGFAMGTVVNQTIYSDDKDIASEVTSLLTSTEEKYISWRVKDSDIGKINSNSKTGTPTDISAETATFIHKALKISADSHGAFDPTIGKLSRLWDFDNNPSDVPPADKITKVMKSVGYENITLADNSVTIKNNSSVDLGAMGKGIGCDEIQTYLDGRKDVSGYLLNIGGSSIMTYGEKSDGQPWKVAVLNPRDSENYLGAISLEGTKHVSTSGDYERYFEKDGKRYHHILDPETGYPADSGLISVTVVTDNGATCDALSTACFVLGREKAEVLLKEYEAEGIFVDSDKNIYVTDGLKDRFELMADDYTLK